MLLWPEVYYDSYYKCYCCYTLQHLLHELLLQYIMTSTTHTLMHYDTYYTLLL